MTMRVPTEPILATPVDVLPTAGIFEPKWDGYRALVLRPAEGPPQLLSRRGTQLTVPFGDLAAAAQRDLPPDVLLDGEAVIWHDGRLAFELLQRRLNRTPAGAAKEAGEHPANYVAFDLLHEPGRDLTALPYTQRRARLEALFTNQQLGPPWVLCPATTDRAEAQQWMRDWAPAGVEGLVIKNPAQRYRPGERGWRKYRTRHTTEAIIGAVAGSISAPSTLLVGRYDATGRLRLVGRSTVLDQRRRADLARHLTAAGPDHPWAGHTFTPTWGSRERRPMIPVVPDLVAEISVDTAFEAGRWRHAVRFVRLRDDVAPADVPPFGEGAGPAME